MKAGPQKFFIGSILNPRSDRRCDFLPRGVLCVRAGASGQILEVLPLDRARKRYAGRMNARNTVDFGDSVILPGFFDMHFHWVQDDVRQMPKDSLLKWLGKYTFPTEARFASASYSRKKSKEFFTRLIRVGTLGGAVFSSIHENALRDALREARGDFIIGNVQMNQNSPPELTQDEKTSLSGVRRFFKEFGSRYAFTPRFAITASPRVMTEGARMADRKRAFKQTHLAETPDEIDYTLSLYRKIPGFETVKNYTEIYLKTSMLGPRALMAHGIHLSESEWRLIRKTRTALIHCPTSNAPISEQGLGSGLFDFQKAIRMKVRWALGSDIGGGPFLSMWDVIRSFVDQNEKAGKKGATRVCGLYRATLAGAEILGVDKRTGNLNPGKEASFIVVPLPGSVGEASAEGVLTRLIDAHSVRRDRYDGCVSHVYLRGQRLYSEKTRNRIQ